MHFVAISQFLVFNSQIKLVLFSSHQPLKEEIERTEAT